MKWKECDVRDGKGVVSSGKGSGKVKQEKKLRFSSKKISHCWLWQEKFLQVARAEAKLKRCEECVELKTRGSERGQLFEKLQLCSSGDNGQYVVGGGRVRDTFLVGESLKYVYGLMNKKRKDLNIKRVSS